MGTPIFQPPGGGPQIDIDSLIAAGVAEGLAQSQTPEGSGVYAASYALPGYSLVDASESNFIGVSLHANIGQTVLVQFSVSGRAVAGAASPRFKLYVDGELVSESGWTSCTSTGPAAPASASLIRLVTVFSTGTHLFQIKGVSAADFEVASDTTDTDHASIVVMRVA
jgi:hypothetical protein